MCVCALYNSWPVAGRGSFFAPMALYNDLPVAVCGHLCLCKSIGRGFPAMSIVMLAHIHQTFCFASIFMQCACRVVRIDVAYNLKSHAKACEYKFLYILSLLLCRLHACSLFFLQMRVLCECHSSFCEFQVSQQTFAKFIIKQITNFKSHTVGCGVWGGRGAVTRELGPSGEKGGVRMRP